MSRRDFWQSGRGAVSAGLCLAAMAAAIIAPATAQEEPAPRINFYPSLQLKFVDGEAHNYFISHAGVVNVSGSAITDLTITQRFPEGFTASPVGEGTAALLMRPEGFSESLENGVYTVHLPELRLAEATALLLRLDYQGRPGETTFPGIEVQFTMNGEKLTEKGPDLTWDLAKYTRYSGTLREFIKRYASLDLKIPPGDWGFTNLAARVAGRVVTGPVEIEIDRVKRMRFSIEAGEPGDLRQMLVIRRPYDPARHQLKARDEVRRLVNDSVSVTADFTLDPDEFSIRQEKVGRYADAWVADTIWHDKVKDRLGQGPSRWYIITDEKAGTQYIINIAAQGRGLGPGKADVPNPENEKALMSGLEAMVGSLRAL